MVADHDVTVFGSGAGYLLACAKEELHPGKDCALDTLRAVGATGSPLPASGFRWIQEGVGRQIPVVSASGGTDLVTAFVGGCPLLPIVAGELNCICLGAAVEAWSDEGRPVIGQAGELVLTQPMPSMPVFFLNVPDAAATARRISTSIRGCGVTATGSPSPNTVRLWCTAVRTPP